MDAKGLHKFYFDELKWCGCGDPEGVMEFVGEVLAILKQRSEDNNDHHLPYEQTNWKRHTDALTAKLGDGPIGLILMYVLDAHGLTEHGGNVMGSWLTDKGHAVLGAIRSHLTEAFDDEAAWRFADEA